MPADSSSGRVLYPVVEYYKNGKLKRTVNSKFRDVYRVVFEGDCIDYYPNGNKKDELYYYNNEIEGKVTRYYPNGKLHSSEYYNDDNTLKLLTCYDSTGKVMADNGNGKWLTINESPDKQEEGEVKDGLQTGKWHGFIATDTSSYDVIYVAGKPTTGTGYDKTGKAYPFKEAGVEPKYKKGEADFNEFLARNIHYPDKDKLNNIQGRVIVTFVIEKNGVLTNIQILRAPDQSLGDEAARAVALSPPWNPGLQYGMPVRVQFTIPINFGLGL